MIVEIDNNNLEAAAMIHSESWKESHRHFCIPEFIEMHNVEHQKEYLQNEMLNGKKLFMLLDERPVGIVSVNHSLIENLYILPQEQRKGYGTKLLLFAMNQCDDTPCLWILSNNNIARAMYSKHGFLPTGNTHQITDSLCEIEFRLSKPADAPEVN